MAKRRRGAPTPRAIGRAQPEPVRVRPPRPPSRPLQERGGRSPLLIGGIAAAVLLALGVGTFFFVSGASRPNYECGTILPQQAGATVDSPIVTPSYGGAHQAPGSRLEYASCPPASGPHYQQSGVAPARPAAYGPDSNIGPGSWVHNLEHGFVVALYRCVDDVCPSDDVLSDLRRFVLQGPSSAGVVNCGYPSKVLAARFDDMSTPFALVSWERVLLLDSFDPDVALQFARRWIEASSPVGERGAC